MTKDNVGKCGHARCAGGNGCFEKGRPMSTYKPAKVYHGITLNDLYNPLYNAFNYAVDEVLQYESDTFSSEASGITPHEAEQVVMQFLLEGLEEIRLGNSIDGGMIAEKLEVVRDLANTKDNA